MKNNKNNIHNNKKLSKIKHNKQKNMSKQFKNIK